MHHDPPCNECHEHPIDAPCEACGRRPPVSNLILSLRLTPADRARLEALADYYRQTFVECVKRSIEASYRVIAERQAEGTERK
jgi:hypothetical protein